MRLRPVPAPDPKSGGSWGFARAQRPGRATVLPGIFLGLPGPPADQIHSLDVRPHPSSGAHLIHSFIHSPSAPGTVLGSGTPRGATSSGNVGPKFWDPTNLLVSGGASEASGCFQGFRKTCSPALETSSEGGVPPHHQGKGLPWGSSEHPPLSLREAHSIPCSPAWVGSLLRMREDDGNRLRRNSPKWHR